MATTRVKPRQRSRRPTAPAASDDRRPSIWREALWALDWLSLRLSPVYLGFGVPRGDGGAVVLVPGFLTTDVYLAELYLWLRRIGHRPYLSGIIINADCIQILTQRLERTVEKAYQDTGRPVTLIGHSLGGYLARRVALQRPDIVTQIISLGAPIQSLEAHPAVMAVASFVTGQVRHFFRPETDPRSDGEPQGRALGICPSDRCECAVDHCVIPPATSVRRAAIYSRTDGVIHWRHCLEPDPTLNHEVGGTHLGLAFNPRAYRVVGKLLAPAAEDRGRRAA